MANIRMTMLATALMAPVAAFAQGVQATIAIQESSAWMKCAAALAVIGFIAARRRT